MSKKLLREQIKSLKDAKKMNVIQLDEQIKKLQSDIKNNKIDNLPQEDTIKPVKKRDYTFVKDNYKNKTAVKAISIDGDISIYPSMYQASKKTGVNVGIVSNCIKCLNAVKGGNSKIDGKYYRFEYSDIIPVKTTIKPPRKSIKTEPKKQPLTKKEIQAKATAYYKNRYLNDINYKNRLLATQKKYYQNKKLKLAE
jgi:hypothetical protein